MTPLLHLAAIWPWPFRLIQDMWWPEAGQGYAVFSSVGGDTAILGAILIFYRARNCHATRCWRIGKHHVEGTPYVTCAKHHPDIDQTKPVTAEHIHAAHRAHLKRLERPARSTEENP